ncbi:MAG: DUF1214 domain-containing protein [Myxococcota bacterium]
MTAPSAPPRSASGADRLDAAWHAHRARVEALRERMLASPLAADPADRVRAHAWLMQAQAAAYNLAIAPRSSHPKLLLSTVFEPNVYSWLLPNADFLYRYAFLDGGRRFRLRGTRGSAHFLEAQTIRGFWGDPDLKLLSSYDLGRFEAGPDGRLEIAVSATKPSDCPNWIAIDPSSSMNTLILREAFYDWSSERRAELSLEPEDGPLAPVERSAEEFALRLDAASRMLDFCFQAFSGGLTQEVLDAVGTNRFRLIDTSRDEHAANPSAGYVPAVYALAEDEALVVEVAAPQARYWNIHLGDVWWQVTDYANRQSSLNGRQVVADPDGVVRIVLSARDPGVANWLDTAGIARGVALLRWYFTNDYPAPAARVVRFDALPSELPATTRRVSAEERRSAIAARRAILQQRYGQ